MRFRAGPMGFILMALTALSLLPRAIGGVVVAVVLFLVATGRL